METANHMDEPAIPPMDTKCIWKWNWRSEDREDISSISISMSTLGVSSNINCQRVNLTGNKLN